MNAPLVFAILLLHASADAEVPWLILPIQSEKPPPKDPTLLRLTKTIGEAVHALVDENVRIASREIRDEHCPQEDGQCPGHVAEMTGAKRAVSIVLSPDYKTLTLRIFKGTAGLEKEGAIPCAWDKGDVRCEVDKLKPIFEKGEPPPAFDPEAVKAAFEAFRPKLARCKADRKDVSVSFRVRPDGHVVDVRIQPDELQDDPPYACVARTVESLRLHPFTSDKPEPFRFDLVPTPKPKSKVDRKKKSG